MTNTILDTKLETVGIHDVATKRKLLTLYLRYTLEQALAYNKS